MTRLAPVCAAVALALGVAACAAGPTYRSPDTPARLAPAAFAETSAATALTPAPPRWWKLYDAPGLDALVEKALAANTDLRQADANLRLARGALSEIAGERLPSTQLFGGASFGRRSGTSGASGATSTSGSTTTPSIRSTYTDGFTVAYDLDLFGRLRRGIEAARADVGAREAALDLARTQVAAETTRAYVQACAFGLQADVARQSLQLVTETYAITVRQRDLGAGTDFDVARARTLVEQTRAPVPQFEASRRSALYALAVLTGEPPERVPEAAAACRTPPKLVQPLPVGDGRSLMARRPDVRQAERTLAASVARIGVRTADLYPTITLGGNVAGFGTGLSTLTSERGLTFGVGPMLSWSFPNVVVARARIRQAEVTAQASLAAFDGTVLTALRETETALATYGGELDRNVALTEARNQAQEALRIANLRFQIGSASFLDTLDSQRTFVDTQAAVASSLAALASDQINVFKALGGGWEQAPPVAQPKLPTAR